MASTYSFMDVSATLAGAAGVIDLGYGSQVAEEGIEWSFNNPVNTMTIGSDGEGMHSLHCDKSGTVKVRLLETSPVNAKLTAAYNAQRLGSKLWGKQLITITNAGNDTVCVCRSVAFQGMPGDVFTKDGAMKEWVFDCIKIDVMRGTYEE